MEYKELPSGAKMPMLGLGTWQNTGSSCKEAVKTALENGYTHIDTALMYENHRDIAEALKETTVNRENIFITSKIWFDDLSSDGVKKQVDKILDELELDYIDLVLIHWPNSDFDMEETFKALSEEVDNGRVKDIGVSNFTISHLEKAIEASPKKIAMNQVEYHPYLNQEKLLNFCKENGIHITAYSPLARSKVFDDKVLEEIAEEKGKSISQVVLRWLIEKGIIVIPKSSSPERIKQNLEVFDFSLDEKDMERINSLNENHRILNPSFAEFDD